MPKGGCQKKNFAFNIHNSWEQSALCGEKWRHASSGRTGRRESEVSCIKIKVLSPCKMVMFLAGVVLWLSPPLPVHATHIGLALDRNFLRSDFRLPQEGYLRFRHVSERLSPNGEERTGWTEVRHPANDGTRNARLGYDRSNFFVEVHNKIVTIRNQTNTADETANPNIPRDYNYADQIWAQAGISVLSTGTQNVRFGTVISPVDNADLNIIMRANRQPDLTVNNWYATNGFSTEG